MNMKLKDFDYFLPQELIAQQPLKERDHSRLMVLYRKGKRIEHSFFYNIGSYLRSGDLLVANNTRVIPARLFGKKITGGKVEILLLSPIDKTIKKWQCLVRARKRPKDGTIVYFHPSLKGTLYQNSSEWIISFEIDQQNIEDIIEKIGHVPLPPYIKRPKDNPQQELDRDRYQTVFSSKKGAVAAPTAGLHFSDSLIESLKSKGIEIVFITLHVGLGTFKPIRTEEIEKHKMHPEYFELPEETAHIINTAKRQGCRIISVGTTTTRVLESQANPDGTVKPATGYTDLFIYPGFKFKVIDAMITNFHLPKSTLLLLVSAFAGREFIMTAYREAIAKRYRFYSYGDAMLII